MKKKQNLIYIVMLPLILAVCFSLWFSMSNTSHVEINSATGVWDLRDYDFSIGSVRCRGAVEFIPNALLTPEEFEARSDEIQIGNPQDVCQYSTSRIRIFVPEGVTFMLSGRSTDYAERIYINGKHVADIGVPGTSRATMVPNTADLSFVCIPEDGVIEIVQQVSNFVHREGGWHDDIRVGYPDLVNEAYRHDFTVIMMGSFLALFIVHLALFFILQIYRANLYFSLFCLIWFLRSGVTGAKVFSSLIPALSWVVKFRIEYLALPATAILIILMLRELFPAILPPWFVRAVAVLSTLFIVIFLFFDTLFMSWAMLGCYAYIALSILIVVACFVKKFRHPNPPQWITLAGLLLFFYAGIRDMFFHSDVIFLPAIPATLSEIAMLIFVFFEMTAMFIGTARAAEDARSIEQRLHTENAMLDRMNRMKNDLMATVSHETRTPLAVLSGYAELIAMELRRKGVDAQTAADLDQIADETQRIAKIMDEMQMLSRNRDSTANRAEVQITDIIRQTARMYEPILARKHLTLTVRMPDTLPTIYANADELTQVMFNLLQNARNHTKSGGVTVSAQADANAVVICVADTGTGISPAFMPHIFERNMHENPDGAGLGLPICKEIIDSLGGEIWLESVPGKGTAAQVSIPICKGGVSVDGENNLIG